MHFMFSAILPGFSTLMRPASSSAQAEERFLGKPKGGTSMKLHQALRSQLSHSSERSAPVEKRLHQLLYIRTPGSRKTLVTVSKSFHIETSESGWMRSETFYELMDKCMEFLVCKDVKGLYVLFSISLSPSEIRDCSF